MEHILKHVAVRGHGGLIGAAATEPSGEHLQEGVLQRLRLEVGGEGEEVEVPEQVAGIPTMGPNAGNELAELALLASGDVGQHDAAELVELEVDPLKCRRVGNRRRDRAGEVVRPKEEIPKAKEVALVGAGYVADEGVVGEVHVLQGGAVVEEHHRDAAGRRLAERSR